MTRALSPSFARGEMSPLLHARVDLSMFQVGLARCENFIVLPQGGLTKRPGFHWWESTGETTAQSPKLIPFIYSSSDSLILVMKNYTCDIYNVNSKKKISTINSPYSIGQAWNIKYAQCGNIIFMAQSDVAPQKFIRYVGDTFAFVPLDFQEGPWGTDIRGSSYTGLDVNYLRITTVNGRRVWTYEIRSNTSGFFTRNDVGRLVEINYAIKQKIVKMTASVNSNGYSEAVEVGSEWYLRTAGSWTGTVTLQRLPAGSDRYDDNAWEDWRPHNRSNANEVGNAELSGSEDERNILYRIKTNVETGTATVTLNASGFTKSNVFKIIKYTNATSVEADFIPEFDDLDYQPIIDTSYSRDWRLGAWANGDYPSAIAFYQDRLCLAGSKNQAQSIWMSQTGSYENFGTTFGNLKDDDAISITLAAGDMSPIHSLVAGQDLLAFTGSSEWRIRGAGENGAITPTAITANRQTSIGSAPVQPFDASGAVLMVQTHRNEVHAFKYTFELDGYAGSNLSIMSEHLFRPGREIIASCYQQVPDSLAWFVLNDGTAACCTFQQEHQVFAWTRQTLGYGRFGDICSVPHPAGFSELYATIRHGTTWQVAAMARRVYENAYADMGYRYTSLMTTLRIPPVGEAFNVKKYIPRVTVYARHSTSCKVTPATDASLRRWRMLKFAPQLGNDMQFEMVEQDIQLDSGFEKHAGVTIWEDAGQPLTILAISPEVTAGG